MSKKSNPLEFPKATVITAEAAAKLIPIRTSKYDAVVSQIKDLKPGQAANFKFGSQDDAARAKNSLTAALITRGIKAPKGFGFYKNIGVNGELIVSVRERNAKRASAAPAK